MTPPVYNAQEHGTLDGTPGYNDFILSCRGETEGDACTINYVDGLPVDSNSGVVDTHAISTEYRAPSERVATRALSFSVNQGARIFSLPEGGYVVRRSIFDGRCTGDVTLVRNYSLTPNQVRAIAAFSGSGYNNMWCFAPEDGQTYGDGARRPYQTPWNLQSREGLLAFKTAIDSVLAGNASTSSQTRALADLSDEDRASLETIRTEIDQRVEQTQEDSLLNQPWYVLVLHACLFGLAFWGMAELGNTIKAAINNRRGGGDGDGTGGGGGIGDEIAAMRQEIADLRAAQEAGEPATETAGELASEFSAVVDGIAVPLPPELAHMADTSYSMEGFLTAMGYNPADVMAYAQSLTGELPMTVLTPTSVYASTPLEQGALQYSGAAPEGTFTTSSLLGGMMQLGGEGAPVYGSIPGAAPELSLGSGVPGVVGSVVPPPMAAPVPVVVPVVAPVAIPVPVLVVP